LQEQPCVNERTVELVTADCEDNSDGCSEELVVASVMGVPADQVCELDSERFAVESLAEFAAPGEERFDPFVRPWLIVELTLLDATSALMGFKKSCCQAILCGTGQNVDLPGLSIGIAG
jgi:hypothetical protein